MLKAYVLRTRVLADRVVAAIDNARNPDGTEEVRLPNGSRERRPATTWAIPTELDDGQFFVPYEERRLGSIAGREVTVRGERIRVPTLADVVDVEIVEQPDGSIVKRERRNI